MGTLLLIDHCCVRLFCVSCIDDVVAILSHCCDIPVLGRVKKWLPSRLNHNIRIISTHAVFEQQLHEMNILYPANKTTVTRSLGLNILQTSVHPFSLISFNPPLTHFCRQNYSFLP